MSRSKPFALVFLALVAFVGTVRQAPAADPLSGIVEPFDLHEVRAREAGNPESVLAYVGKSVKKGEPLVILDKEKFQYACDVAKIKAEDMSPIDVATAEVNIKNATLSELRAAFEKKQVSYFVVQRAAADLEGAKGRLGLARTAKKLAELDYRMAKAALERRTLRSPIDGIVVEMMKLDGPIGQGALVARVGDATKIGMKASLPAGFPGEIAKGTTVPVRFANGMQRMAEVVSVGPATAGGTRDVRLVVANPTPGKLPALGIPLLFFDAERRRSWFPQSVIPSALRSSPSPKPSPVR